MSKAFQACPKFVVSFNREPGGLRDICSGEHDVLGFGIFHPAVSRLNIHGAQLPPPFFAVNPGLETLLLLIVIDREPVFEQ